MPNLKISELTAGNPAVSGDQIPINRGGTNFSVTAESIAALSTGPTLGTASPSWWGSGDGSPFVINPTGGGDFRAASNNQVKFWMIRVSYAISVSKLSLRINTLAAGSHFAFGVYNSTGSTKLFSWDNVDPTGGGNKNTSFASVPMPPGIYIVACGSTDASAATTTFGGYSTSGTNETVIAWNNNGTVRAGVAANGLSSGNMPSSLGTLSTSASIGTLVPLVVMEA
jgi:hypothetical protein